MLQTFLQEITDTAGLFLSRSRPIFIITKVAPQLTHPLEQGPDKIDRHLLLAFQGNKFQNRLSARVLALANFGLFKTGTDPPVKSGMQ